MFKFRFNIKTKIMTLKNHSQNDVLFALTQFLSYDLLQEEIQQLPLELQGIFDLVLDTDAGNSLELRRKMLRIKELMTQLAKALEPFTEDQVQQSYSNYQNKVSCKSLV